MKKKLVILGALVIILLIGALSRYYKLGEAPKGLYIDEAGQGYSAYSILKTGKDEFGKPYPVVFRSFTDFKTPVYIYLIVPLIPLFDLTAYTVRLPSFIFSVLTFPVLFLLIRKISPREAAIPMALLSCLLLAISPWHILFGRTTFECNVALFFFLSGVYTFYIGLEKPRMIILSAILFAIAIPAYHSQRVVTPLMLLLLSIRHYKILLLRSHRNWVIGGALIGFLLLIPTLSVATTPGFLARATGLNIFSHHRQVPAGYSHYHQGFLEPIVNNSVLLSAQEFMALYSSYFSPRQMFALGDYGPRSSFPELATFFVWQFPFYFFGLFLMIKRKELKELRFFTLALLLIAPIPAAVTRDPYTTIRALPLVIPQLIVISLGILESFYLVSKVLRRYRISKLILNSFGLALLLIVVVYSLFKLHSSVILLNEYYRAEEWDYGWEEIVGVLNQYPDLPVTVDISREEAYIELLFFLKFDPVRYQRENVEVSLDEYYSKMDRLSERKIGRITTKVIDWGTETEVEQILVADELAISKDQIEDHKLTLIKEVYYPDRSVAYRIVKTNP